MQNNKKIVWLLILQGWAMLWVVIGHAGPANTLDEYPPYALTLWNFAYSFHMQLFISISGFLFYLTRLNSSKWSYWPMLKEKLIRFGIPFIVWTFFAMVLKSVFSSEVERPTSISLGEFVNAIIYPYNGPMREFWFLGVLFWMFAFFPIWKLLLKNSFSIILTSVLLILFYFNYPNTDLLALNHVSVHASFFWWGILAAKCYDSLYIQKSGNSEFCSSFVKNTNWIGLVTLFFLSCLIYYWSVEFSYPYISAIGGILLSLCLCLAVYKLSPNIFVSFRNYTYQIYLLGLFAQEFVKLIRYKMDLPFLPVYVLSVLAGLYIPVIISLIVEKTNLKSLNLCIGLK